MKIPGAGVLLCFLAISAAAADLNTSPVGKLISDYIKLRSDAIKDVNQKYIPLADAEMKITLKESNLEKANAINSWGKRLADTDDRDNTSGIVPGAAASGDRLAVLQAAYLKERTEAVMLVNKSYVAYAEAARQKAMQDGDLDGANAANELLAKIKVELGGGSTAATPSTASTAAGKPFGVQGSTSGGMYIAPAPTPTPVPPSMAASGTHAAAGTPAANTGFVPGVGFASGAGPGNSSPFAGTTWISITHIGGSNGATATLTFKADGSWTEDYAPNPVKGRWKATKQKNVVEVTLAKGGKIGGESVVHFTISDDGKNCTRQESSVGYALVKKE